MTLRLLIGLSVPLIAAQKLCAQLAPADDFFNGGAQFYISNNVPAALERVENGLKTYPDDEKLKKLEQLLKQQQSQQQQQNQQNQSQQQKSDSQKNQQQQKQQQQNSQNQQKQDEQKQADQKKDGQQQSSADKKNGGQSDKQDAAGQPVKAGEMTPEEAKHLLDAQKDNEQLLQMKPQEKPHDPDRPVRDW
jgi:Ca-activated chloride channel family protein